jgi:type IV pilus biogenesis protein CpaD/CtpE
MIRTFVGTAGIAVLLSGCADGAVNFGAAPPIALTTAHRELSVALDGSRVSNLRLQRSIEALAAGDRQAVRAHIVAPSAAQNSKARQVLIALGLDPARIVDSVAPGRSTTVVLTRTTASAQDCASAITLAYPNDPMPSLLSLSRCTQRNNLAAMVVDPADLIAPPPLGHADGAYLVNGVRSWRSNRQTQLPSISTTSGGEFGLAGATSSSATSSTVPSANSVPPTTSQTQTP